MSALMVPATMPVHVSDDKRVHQALVDPKSIVPYYVVWDMNVITR
jgi:hypothetical protein